MNDTRAPFGARVFSRQARVRALASLLIATALLGCGGPDSRERSEEGNEIPSRSIDEVLAAHADDLLARPGVTIVYQGALEDGAPCITVGVIDKEAPSARELPPSLEGYPVVLQETGELGPR